MSTTLREIQLSDYDVHPARGFLPAEDPLTSLPPAFGAWDELGAQLPAVLLAGRVRASIDALAWSRVSVVLAGILATVLVAEVVSARLRRGLS